jgi:hypothetical protein
MPHGGQLDMDIGGISVITDNILSWVKEYAQDAELSKTIAEGGTGKRSTKTKQ